MSLDPFVFDPSWSRWELWYKAQQYVGRAIRYWMVPPITVLNEVPANPRRYGTGGRLYGLFTAPNQIQVNVAEATTPARTLGRVWSFPGYKTDRTCAGILAHEFGHYLFYHTIHNAQQEERALWRETWRHIVQNTKPVTSYEPTHEEAFAETARIFIMNPNLLELGRPLRYSFLVEHLHFAPLHKASWKEVLVNAPDFIIKQAQRFCEEKPVRKRSLF